MTVRRWSLQGLGCIIVLGTAIAATEASAASRPTLTVTIAGKGSVTSVPGGISCPRVCRSSYRTNARIRLIAHPARGWRLNAWSGECFGNRQCAVKLVGPTRVRATFAKNPSAVVPAKVALLKSGFSVAANDTIGSFVGLGLVLRNVSPDEDALHVAVTVNILDASNSILKTESSTIEAIPAGSTYYFGDDAFLDTNQQPRKLEVVLQVGKRAKKGLTLPPVANLRLSNYRSSTSGGIEIDGQLSNPFTKSLSLLARITGVLFDSAGKVIGGGSTHPQNEVPPGKRIGFAIFVPGAQLAQAASAQVSVEPEFAG